MAWSYVVAAMHPHPTGNRAAGKTGLDNATCSRCNDGFWSEGGAAAKCTINITCHFDYTAVEGESSLGRKCQQQSGQRLSKVTYPAGIHTEIACAEACVATTHTRNTWGDCKAYQWSHNINSKDNADHCKLVFVKVKSTGALTPIKTARCASRKKTPSCAHSTTAAAAATTTAATTTKDTASTSTPKDLQSVTTAPTPPVTKGEQCRCNSTWTSPNDGGTCGNVCMLHIAGSGWFTGGGYGNCPPWGWWRAALPLGQLAHNSS